jgi:hypothetical protein
MQTYHIVISEQQRLLLLEAIAAPETIDEEGALLRDMLADLPDAERQSMPHLPPGPRVHDFATT